MSELVTLSKNSRDFESYLLGTFSKSKRALPVQTLNVNSAAETVTFRIVSLQDIAPPTGFVWIAQTLKLRSFIFVLVPLFLVLTKNIISQRADATAFVSVDPLSAVLASIGVLLAFLSANFRNDFMDHMKGIDRVLVQSGSRAIQKGWVTAAQLKYASTLLLAASMVCSVPLLLVSPWLAGLVLFGVIVGVWAQFKSKNSFKYRIGGELSIFLMLGPLLTVGYQVAITGTADSESFWVGVVWGWLVLFVVHLRNFLNILPSAQAGFSNTINWLGFDRSRRMIAAWWGLFVVFNLILHWTHSGLSLGFYLGCVLALISIPFVLKLKKLASPVGSELRQVYRFGFYLFLIAIGFWVFECLWFLLR